MNQAADTRPLLLLVDDEPTNLQVLRHILQEGYRLLFAKEGMRALEMAERERPDLILLDVMMPGMTGYEVCEQLKASPELKTIPVIFVSALGDVEDETRGFEVGAVDYITKPVSPPIVRARCARICRWCVSTNSGRPACRSFSVWVWLPSTRITKRACT